MAILTESSFMDLAKHHPPLGWHHQHTQWQTRPLGHLSASVQTKPLCQAAQLVGLPAELGDGSGFSNFGDGTDTTTPIFNKLQQFSPTPQSNIQPLWQQAVDLSQNSFQIAQSTDISIDSDGSDSISETTASPTVNRSTGTEIANISSNTLPTISHGEDRRVENKRPSNKQIANPLQQQPLGQHQPLGFNPTTDIAEAITPLIQPSVASPSDISIDQQLQSSWDIALDSDPEITSEHLARTEIPPADDENTFSSNQQTATPLTDPNSPADIELDINSEPGQESFGIANVPLTDIQEIAEPMQRASAVSPDIDTTTDRLSLQTNDVTPITANPEPSQQADIDDIIQETTPIERTDMSSPAIQPAVEQSQASPQQSFSEQTEPSIALDSSTSNISFPDVSPSIQPQSTAAELPTVIQPSLDSSVEPKTLSESFEAESDPMTSESEANDGTEVLKTETEKFSEVQLAPDQSEVLHQPSENIELPLLDDNSVSDNTAQRIPEISTQQVVSPANEIDDSSTMGLADIQAKHVAIPETQSSGAEPTEILPSELSNVQQESTAPVTPDTLLAPQSDSLEQVIQHRQVDALPSNEEFSGQETNSFSSEQFSLDVEVEQEQSIPSSFLHETQSISPDDTPSFQAKENLQPQLQPPPETSRQSADSSSLVESEASEIQDISSQLSAQLPVELPPIQAKLPSAPAIQPLGMHEPIVDSLTESINIGSETAPAEVTSLSSIQRKQTQVRSLSPKLAALTSKYGSDAPDDNFWSSDPLISSRLTSQLDLETPAVETDSREAVPIEVQTQTVSLSILDTLVESGESAHVSSGESEDQALWQLAHVLYSELRNDRGVRSQLTSSTFQRARPDLMPIQSEHNKHPHLPLALWPPPMHQLATSVRLQLQARLGQDFERSARCSKFV